MDRKQIIAKIQSILKLQEGTSFDGEASAAANLIDKLCKQYGITITEATETQVLDESFINFKRVNVALTTLLNAIATFYDAKAYMKNGDVKSLQITGKSVSRSFKLNFRKAFADKVALRLREMKEEENRVHDDAKAVSSKLSTMRFGRARRMNGASGEGAYSGSVVGAGVSLHRQASGSQQRQLCGV